MWHSIITHEGQRKTCKYFSSVGPRNWIQVIRPQHQVYILKGEKNLIPLYCVFQTKRIYNGVYLQGCNSAPSECTPAAIQSVAIYVLLYILKPLNTCWLLNTCIPVMYLPVCPSISRRYPSTNAQNWLSPIIIHMMQFVSEFINIFIKF